MGRSSVLTWRQRFTAAAILACAAALTFNVAGAFADAGNPILGTIKANAKDNGSTVTIYVRGQWNWLSHGSDCNFDRAATGVGIIWNDFNGAPKLNGQYQRGANEKQRIALSGTLAGAHFTITWKNLAGTNLTSAAINFGDTTNQVDAKLEAIMGAGNVSVATNANNGWDVTFVGGLATTNVNQMTAGNKTGGLTVTLSTLTAGTPAVTNGYLVANGAIQGYVGYKFATTDGGGADQMVHPVDRGNQVEGYRTPGSDYPANQPFFDPNPSNVAATSTWKGGCGRLPLSATGSKGNPFGESSPNQPCADGSNPADCAGEPWGSWGYEKCSNTTGTPPGTTAAAQGPCAQAPGAGGFYGYSHTYKKFLDDGSSGLPDKVCVNFYDVHTQTSGSYIPKSGDITVDGNGDNSIDTNAFNVGDTSQGGNCIAVATPAIKTTATDATIGDANGIHDTAELTGVPSGVTGNLVFKAYKRTGANPDCSGVAAFNSGNVPTTGSGTFGSGNFNPTSAGTYDWLVSWTSNDPLVLPVTAACGDQTNGNDETSDVGKKQPTLTTDAGGPYIIGPNGLDLTDTATLTNGFSPFGGTITFTLYSDANCQNQVGSASIKPAPAANGGSVTSDGIHITSTGTYHWKAHYDGDTNNKAADSGCGATNENPIVNPRQPEVSTNAGAAKTLTPTGVDLFDSAILSNGTSNIGGTITFHLYFNSNGATDCAAADEVAGSPVTASVSGNGPYPSPSIHVTKAGLYKWIANYGGDTNNLATQNGCDGTNESVTVNPVSPTVNTNAGPTVRFNPAGTSLTDTATLAGGTPDISGKITFSLYFGANCDPANIVNTTDKTVTGNGQYSATFSITQPGQYHWIANYGGDSNNLATSNTCFGTNEDVFVINPSIDVVKTTSTPTIESGDTAMFHIKVTNTGNSTLTNVHVDDAQAPGCARSAADIAADRGSSTFLAGDIYEYDCSVTGKTSSFTNVAVATGTPEVGGNVTDMDSAPVEVIHPHIDVQKDPKSQSIPSGGTAHFTITVKNDGDTPLSGITVTDPNSPDCNRDATQTAALILGQTGHAEPLLVNESFFYTCELQNVTSSFTNVVTGCGTDKLAHQVCDTDEVPNQIPNCPEVERCGTIQVSGIVTVQDPKPKDTATIGGLIGSPGGTLTWSLFKGPGCDPANQVDLNGGAGGKDLTAAVTQNGDYTVTAADFLSALLGSNNTAGTYNWLVSYSGDPASNNAAIDGMCGTENFTIANG